MMNESINERMKGMMNERINKKGWKEWWLKV